LVLSSCSGSVRGSTFGFRVRDITEPRTGNGELGTEPEHEPRIEN
jgi:hypothetical protein